MKTTNARCTILGLLLAFAAAAPVASHAMEVRPMAKLGFDFGGDTLVTAVFTDGSSQSVKANEGIYLGGGVSIVPGWYDMVIELSIAWKWTGVTAENGEINWTRYPLEALVFHRVQQFRFGGGLTYHINPKLDGSGVVGGLNVKFKDALGFILQADYVIWKGLAAGLRYTSIDYEVADGSAPKAKSNGAGITASWSF